MITIYSHTECKNIHAIQSRTGNNSQLRAANVSSSAYDEPRVETHMELEILDNSAGLQTQV